MKTVAKPKRTRVERPEADKERGLLFLAMAAGNAAQAERDLAAIGAPIPIQTLRRWAKADPERYERIQTEVHTRLHHKMAAEAEALVAKAATVQHAYLDRMVAEVAEIPSKELPKAFQATAVAAGIHTDKSRLLRDEPTTITDNRTADEIMRKLVAMGVARRVNAQDVVIESPASVTETAPPTRELSA